MYVFLSPEINPQLGWLLFQRNLTDYFAGVTPEIMVRLFVRLVNLYSHALLLLKENCSIMLCVNEADLVKVLSSCDINLEALGHNDRLDLANMMAFQSDLQGHCCLLVFP